MGSCLGTRPTADSGGRAWYPRVPMLTVPARCPLQDPLLDRLGCQPAPHRGRLHERRRPAHHPQGDGLGGLAQRAHCRLPGEAHPLDRRQVASGHPSVPRASPSPSPLGLSPLPVPPSSGTFALPSVLFCHLSAGLGAKTFALWALFVSATRSSHCSGFSPLRGLRLYISSRPPQQQHEAEQRRRLLIPCGLLLLGSRGLCLCPVALARAR